jgi:hypothetical protein
MSKSRVSKSSASKSSASKPNSEARSDQDSPWKEILHQYFPEAIQFFFPETAKLIDWRKPVTFLETELQQVAVDALVGRRYADLLVKAWRKRGKEMYLLLHLEIQARPEANFGKRTLIYNMRIFNLLNHPVISLAILCDAKADWRPNRYQFTTPDTRLDFEFGIVKLLDYRQRWSELEQSRNPFATVVMAHLKMQETKRDPETRKYWKFWLVRRLYEMGYQRHDVLNLFRFIDWSIMLPEALKQAFWQELRTYEEERRMPYVTSVEEIGFERGHQQGVQEGRQEGEQALVLRLLTRRVGALPDDLRSQITTLSLEQLEALGEALLEFDSLGDLENWLETSLG